MSEWHDEFGVIHDGVLYRYDNYSEALRAAVDDPASMMVRRKATEWRQTC